MLVEQPRSGVSRPGDQRAGSGGSRHARSAGYSISMEGWGRASETSALRMLVE
jgi:hypothetical protein